MFGPKTKEILDECRKLYDEEFYNSMYSKNTVIMVNSRRMRLAGCKTLRVVVAKPEGNRPVQTVKQLGR
jgi:hypothetical protein